MNGHLGQFPADPQGAAGEMSGFTRFLVSGDILGLEPSDVVTLREVLSGETLRAKATAVGGEFREHEPVLEALIVAGCIQDDNKTRGGLYVTALGRAVVKVLELWR